MGFVVLSLASHKIWITPLLRCTVAIHCFSSAWQAITRQSFFPDFPQIKMFPQSKLRSWIYQVSRLAHVCSLEADGGNRSPLMFVWFNWDILHLWMLICILLHSTLYPRSLLGSIWRHVVQSSSHRMSVSSLAICLIRLILSSFMNALFLTPFRFALKNLVKFWLETCCTILITSYCMSASSLAHLMPSRVLLRGFFHAIPMP